MGHEKPGGKPRNPAKRRGKKHRIEIYSHPDVERRYGVAMLEGTIPLAVLPALLELMGAAGVEVTRTF